MVNLNWPLKTFQNKLIYFSCVCVCVCLGLKSMIAQIFNLFKMSILIYITEKIFLQKYKSCGGSVMKK